MAIRTDFTAGEVLAAADLNDTFGAKLNLAGGKILQVVRATDSTTRSTTSTSFVDVTGMSVTITPQKSTSAILVISTFDTLATNNEIAIHTITDSSNNSISGTGGTGVAFGALTSNTLIGFLTLIGYATPATTSATTYKLRFRCNGGASVSVRNATVTGQMYAIEVSA